jgi:hypothetical protein
MFSARKLTTVSSVESDNNQSQQEGVSIPPQSTASSVSISQSTAPIVPQTSIGSGQVVSAPEKNNSHQTHSKYLFVIPVLLIVFVMVAVSTYLQIGRGGLLVEETPMPTLTSATPVPSATPIPVIRDKTYQNRNLLLSFSCPGEHELLEVPDSVGQATTVNLRVPPADESYFSVTIDKAITLDGFNNLVLGLSKEDLAGRESYYLDASGEEGVLSKIFVFYQNTSYTFSWPGPRSSVEKIIKSIKFLSPGVTDKWQTFDSSFGQFSLRYPEEWKLVSGGSASASANIRKIETDSEYHSLLIQIDKPGAQDRNRSLQLTASETISSLQNLSGWVSTPVVDYRNIGGGQAQIISGQRQGGWEVYAVMWYRTSLAQFAWRDTLNRIEQENIDSVLESVRFR